MLDTLATKSDLAAVRADLTTEIAKLETRLTYKLYGGLAILVMLVKGLDFLIGPQVTPARFQPPATGLENAPSGATAWLVVCRRPGRSRLLGPLRVSGGIFHKRL